MNEALYTYTADMSDRWYLWGGIALALVAFYVAYYLLKKPAKGRTHTRNAMLAMLFFFLGLLATGTAFFSGWNLRKQGSVNIYTDAIEVGAQRVPYQQVAKIFIKQDKSASPFTGQQAETINFLVIQERGGKVHALSEQQYPIGEIRGRLEAVLQGE